MRGHAKASSAGANAARNPKVLAVLAAALLATLVAGVALAAAAAPSVTVENAFNVGYVNADVKGTVDPEGQPTTWRFEFISDAKYQENLANSLPAFEGATSDSNFLEGSTEAEETVVRQIGGTTETLLTPSTTYHLRLLAENADGPSEAVAASTFETKAMAAPTVTIEPVTEVTATSARFAGIVNPNAPGPAPQDEAFRVDWKFECSPSCDGGPRGGVAADNTDTPVGGSAQLSPNTEYTVTLRATNVGGLSAEDGEIGGEPVKFTTPALAPTVANAPYMPLAAGSVRLRGFVNPRNSALSECRFAYSADNSFAQSAPCNPMPGVVDDVVEVSADLTGLAPGATYNFRLIATNQVDETVGDDATFTAPVSPQPQSCANEAFRTHSAANLPDCRAYEMVSPPDKNGGEVMSSSMKTRMSPDGDAAVFASLSGFGDVLGTGVETSYASLRDESGWRTHSLVSKQEPQPYNFSIANISPSYDEFSEDLTRGIYFAVSPLTDAANVATSTNLYLRSNVLTPGAGAYSLLTDSALALPAKGERHLFIAASDDFSHVLFSSYRRLLPEVTPCDEQTNQCIQKLYEWDNGAIRLVGILPDGQPATCPEREEQTCSAVGTGGSGPTYRAPTAMNSDGSRAFFSTPVSGAGEPIFSFAGNHTQLYMREDHASTVMISESERDTPDPDGAPSIFMSSSADGSKVFFSSSARLTNDAPPNGESLYMYDADRPSSDPHNLSLLSEDEEPADDGLFRGVIGHSDDGSYVYFLAQGQLVAGGPSRPFGLVGIYVRHDGVTRYIGALAEAGEDILPAAGDAAPALVWRTSRVTPDGKQMIFTSRSGEGLGGYDHGEKNCDEPTHTKFCSEIYVYDYEGAGGAGELSCASCNPSGAKATAEAMPAVEVGKSNTRSTNYLNHALSEDGRRVFFSTREPLVPEDTNGAIDAYVYDTETGEQHLLSSGQSPENSFFLDASPSGDDALISTRERFVGIDTDGGFDLYDVRVGGGIAAQNPPPPPAPCAEDACQGAPAGSPPVPPPGSASPSGRGNAPGREASKPCPKGKHRVKVKGKTRCVKRKRANSHRRASR